jgi:hypothetical protein
MNKRLNQKYAFFILWSLVLILILYIVLTGDRSHVQSAQIIDMEIWPCEIFIGKQENVDHFRINDTPYICGKILSEYLPLELEFVLTKQKNSEEVYYEVRKITDRDFIIKLPYGLESGVYEFEVKSGRRHFNKISFEMVE